MSYSNTTITTRGYSITLPNGMVSAFLSLSHDDQVEVAEAINALSAPEVNETEDEQSVVYLLVESMAAELDQQDQAIELFVSDRADSASKIDWYANLAEAQQSTLEAQRRELDRKRLEIEGLVDRVNYDGTELAAAYADNDLVNNVLAQSARYVGQVRELLSKLGIIVETDNDTGMPVLVIERDRFIASALVVDEA